MRYRILIGIILPALIIALAGPAGPIAAQDEDGSSDAAQSSGIEMRVVAALNGHVRYAEWLPLHVHLTNDGGDIDAEVRADVSGSSGRATYAAPAPLPTGARKEVILYVQPPSFAQAVEVRLVSGEQILAEAEVDVATHPRSTYVIGTLTSDPDAFATLSALTIAGRNEVQLLPLTLETFPARVEALRSLDAVILSALDTNALTPAQAEALQSWVEEGGRLLIGGGVSARRTLSGLPDALRPVELGETVELTTLDSLADFVGEPIRVPGPFPATLPRANAGGAGHRGRVLLRERTQPQGEAPILVQDAPGEGWVGYLALDPAASPFNAWAGTPAFWRRLLEPGAALEADIPRDIPVRALEAEQMAYALSNLPMLELPSARWLSIVLGAYILLVGPVNYLVLHRLRRLDVAWVTIPALTLIFSVAGYGLGYRLRGNDVVINQISILPLHAESEDVAARSYVGLFSPTRRSYDLRIDGSALIGPISHYQPGRQGFGSTTSPMDILQGEPALIRGLTVNQWAMQSFQVEAWLDDIGGVLDADLWIDGDRLHGTIHNHFDQPLEDIVFLLGNRFARLEDIEPGQAVEVDMALESSTSGPPFPWFLFQFDAMRGSARSQRATRLRQSVLEAFFHTNWGPPTAPSTPMLLAWVEMRPLDVAVSQVRASHQSTTLIAMHMPLPVADGRVTLPPGVLSSHVLESEGEAGTCGPSGQVYLGSGEATLEYVLPANVRDIVPSELSLVVSAEGGQWDKPPEVALYDWTQSSWAEIEQIEREVIQTIADPDRFIDGVSGSLRLQVGQRDINSRMCYRFDVGVEGMLSSHVGEVSSE